MSVGVFSVDDDQIYAPTKQAASPFVGNI